MAILTNTIAPYRIPLYEALAAEFEVYVLHEGRESNRKEWGSQEQFLRRASAHRVPGITLRLPHRNATGTEQTRFLQLGFGLVPALYRLRPDAVIGLELGFRTIVALLWCRVTSTPMWVHWGGTPHSERNRGRVTRLLRRLLAPHIDRFFSYGDEATSYLVALGVPRSAIVQLQNSVNEAIFRPDGPRRQFEQPRPRLLCVSRLVHWKGITQLIQAAQLLEDRGETFSLLIVGGGPAEADLHAEVRKRGLRSVHFLGAVAPETLPEIYRGVDALVFPTLDDCWGLVVNEALLCGVPVIASCFAGCAAELLPPENIVDPTNIEALANALSDAAHGRVAPPQSSRMISTRENARRIAASLTMVLGERAT